MLTLTIRTDKPEAELGLYEDSKQIVYCNWQAHRQLAETIHIQIQDMLKNNDKALNDIDSVSFYKGPGSFTGLRIGASVANALANGLNIPIVSAHGSDWIEASITKLHDKQNEVQVLPEYGSPPHITQPKH
jgi:tRNA threonylcarbamoyladenosine biosynthesis protein TsaB